MKIVKICDKVMVFSFSLLFFLVPLILTPWNYELFEYNKMMLVYGLTIIITGSWLIKMVLQKRVLWQKTPFDLPIVLFFVSQFFSFLFSIDRHVSLFGYYSRFNGGLLSVFSYLLLYYALVSNITKEQVLRFLKLSLLSALTVSLYGILEHFGIDKNLWVQDVQNRVFSTLGQPNWLGAYLAILIPIALGLGLSNLKSNNKITSQIQNSKIKIQNCNSKFKTFNFSLEFLTFNFKLLTYFLFSFLFYLCLLYTKSRSGLMGFGLAYIIFWLGIFLINLTKQDTIVGRFVKIFLFNSLIIVLITFIVGAPFTQINRFTLPELLPKSPSPQAVAQTVGPALETGGTESGEIRKIVWSGAIEIARHYPLFGSGPETFAFSYYKFRPIAHNLVSEWDFLYNKAHNEYLNYAATTGFVGLGAYLLFIFTFIIWSLKNFKSEFLISKTRFLTKSLLPIDIGIKSQPSKNNKLEIGSIRNFLLIGLFAAWLSILITNFFGFSVVIISLFFWLIPAMVFVLSTPSTGADTIPPLRCESKPWQKIAVVFILLSTFYFLLSTLRFWYADVRFNAGYQLSRAGYYQQAYQPFHEAIDANPGEPLYRDELSFTDAMLAVAAFQQKESTFSAQLATEAISQNQKALSVSPQNVNFWKTQTKVYYTLSSLDPNSTIFDEKALASLQMAKTLAPTDPKITYNIALLYGRLGKNQEAIKTLEETIVLKPNYQDARYALALFYHEAGKKKEAVAQLEYILQKISPNDKEIQTKLKEWQN